MSHQINDGRTARYSEKRIIARQYIPFKTGESVAACILTKVGKLNQRSGKHKGVSRDFRKKTRFKQWEDQIATNRRSEGIHFVSSETQEHELVFWYLFVALGLTLFYSYYQPTCSLSFLIVLLFSFRYPVATHIWVACYCDEVWCRGCLKIFGDTQDKDFVKMHCVKSVHIRVILVRIFPQLDWIRIDISYLSVLSPNATKCGPE